METKITKPMPTYSPSCACTHEYDDTGRFPVWRIVEFKRGCLAHGYLFTVSVADLLRYGD